MNGNIGIDIIEVDRIKEAVERNKKFLNRIFTDNELSYCLRKKNKYQHLAGKFCAKEAIRKCLDIKLIWREIEIVNNKDGSPKVNLYGNTKEKAKDKNITISISHCKEYATAVCLVENKK